MEVAQIAWDRLTPPVRARVSELLRLNPQYVAWTTNVPDERRDQVAFLRSATWPDFIRGARGYISDGSEGGNRPPAGPEAGQNIGYSDLFMHKYWHFVDLPFSPDGTTLEDPPSPNAQTQIALFRKALSSELATDDVKSYDLAWLIHLVGDVHQPLHATSRFTTGKPHGDAGGNAVTIDCGGCEAKNLHWFWDDVAGIGDNVDDAAAAARLLTQADPRQAAIRDDNVWIAESFELAKATVYQAPIGPGTGSYTLDDAYKQKASELARRRISLAGARLANLLNSALASPVSPRLGCEGPATSPAETLGETQNIDFVKKRLLRYRCVEYDGEIAKMMDDALKWIAARASQVARPAIVLDIDETSLSNWPRIFRDDYPYIPNGRCDFEKVGDPCGDLDWQQSGLAKAIGLTLKLYEYARCIGRPAPCSVIEVFFVTGRREAEHNYEMASVWTLRNLEQAGYAGLTRDHLYVRDPASTGTASEYKTAARTDVENRGFTIIASVGDQSSDLANGHADITFKLPNPFYFIP